MAINYLSKVNSKKLKGVAIIRLDMNDDGWRLERALPTLKKILRHADKLVILSHRGRPKPSSAHPDNKKFSLEPFTAKVSKLLNRPVTFLSHVRLSEANNIIRSTPKGAIFLMENIRFLAGEADNDKELSKHLSTLGDYFVNEAFSVSHRINSSTVGITKFIPSYAGLDLESEITNLTKAIKQPKHPLVIVLGGAKIKDKLGLLAYFRHRADSFLIGGAPANTLLYLQGVKVGKSLVEKEMDGTLLSLANLSNLILPIDYRKQGTAILDIGPKTEKEFISHIKEARTIIWNGPMGATEKKGFDGGTKKIARAIANAKAFTVVGGGESVAFIRQAKLTDKYNFVSTGGGAMLEFLSGRQLPALEALK